MPSRPTSQPGTAAPETVPAGPYWDAVYQRRGPSGVSWFQAEPQTSLDLIRELAITEHAPVIDAGAGASSVAGHLATAGFTDVTAVDISADALEAARQRLAGHPAASRIHWIQADLLAWQPDRRYGVWHDRAVFHFLTEPASRAAYLATARAALQPGGTVILATFAPDGPAYCSGLPVARYSARGLARALGPGFTIAGTRSEQHTTPEGAIQPFTWITATRIA
jgi:2-polyprenyl-3-methyl-5-hydroxy-6-metoxy-1,4-benzoquinol methylase